MRFRHVVWQSVCVRAMEHVKVAWFPARLKSWSSSRILLAHVFLFPEADLLLLWYLAHMLRPVRFQPWRTDDTALCRHTNRVLYSTWEWRGVGQEFRFQCACRCAGKRVLKSELAVNANRARAIGALCHFFTWFCSFMPQTVKKKCYSNVDHCLLNNLPMGYSIINSKATIYVYHIVWQTNWESVCFGIQGGSSMCAPTR